MSDGNDWTVSTLKALVETMLRESDRRWEAEQRAIAEALRKAEVQNEARLALLNEFRQQSQDEQKRFITRVEFDNARDRVSELQEQVHLLQAKMLPVLWVGGVLIVGLVGLFISHLTTGTP